MRKQLEMLPDVFNQFKEFRMTEISGLYNYLPMFNQIEQLALRQNLMAVEWSRGYVKSVHSDSLTTAIGKTALNVIAEKIPSDGVNLTGSESAEQFHDLLGHEMLDDLIYEIGYTALEYGACCTRLLFDGEDVKVEVSPLGTYKATRYFNKEIKDIEIYLDLQGETTNSKGYVLIEYRFYKKIDEQLKPHIKYKVAKLNVTKKDVIERQDIDIKTSIEAAHIKKLYPEVDFDRDTLIEGIDTLGVQIFKGTKINSNFRNVDFGDALLMGAYDILFSNDHSFTNMESDKFIGQGVVILPAHFQGSKLQGFLASENHGVNPETVRGVQEFISGFKEPVQMGKKFYAQAPGLDPENQKPILVQFDLRTDDHEKSMNLSTRLLARFLRISASDLDSALAVATGARTATEVNIEHDLTISTIIAKRKLLTPPLKKMLYELAQAMNFTVDDLDIKWTSLSVFKIDDALRQVEGGIISKEDARKMLHPTMTRKQNEEMVARIEDEASRITEENAFDFTERSIR